MWLAFSPCCSSMGRHKREEPHAWQVQRSGAEAKGEEWGKQCGDWSLDKINHLFVYPCVFSHLCRHRCGIYLLLLSHWIGLFRFWWRNAGVFAWHMTFWQGAPPKKDSLFIILRETDERSRKIKQPWHKSGAWRGQKSRNKNLLRKETRSAAILVGRHEGPEQKKHSVQMDKSTQYF